MKAPLGIGILKVAVVLGLLGVVSLHAQTPTGQWEFNSGSLTATVGTDLTYLDGAAGPTQVGTSFGSTTTLGIPDIGGVAAQVMKFPAMTAETMGYNMPTPGPNGASGTLVNDYTLVLDVLYPAASDRRVRPLLQTSDGSSVAEAAFGITDSNGLGLLPTSSGGQINSNTWYRVAIVRNSGAGYVRFYINGTLVGQIASGDVDNVLAMNPASVAQLFNNATNQAAGGYVNSIQFRDVALNSGQVQALGGPSATGVPQTIPPVPSFIDTQTPAVSATGVNPQPNINVILNQGDTTITGSSIKLYFDGGLAPATVTPSVPTYTIDYTVTTLLDPTSTHLIQLVYQDSVAGLKTNAWSFTVQTYQSITLPAPFAFENFDGIAEGLLPAGWSVTNATDSLNPGIDYTDPKSDAFLDWVVLTTNDLFLAKGGDPLLVPPIAVNGVLLTSMTSNQLIYAESDSRGGNQVQDLFSPDFNCTGKSNVYLSFHSIYQQNQDSLGAVEYSIDQGVTWQPALYMLNGVIDGQDAESDVHRFPDGSIDGFATMNYNDGGQAYNPLPYGTFIGVDSNRWSTLGPFISPRVNDDNIESIRVEVLRLALADGQPKVRLRFIQTGTGSWWFAVDDLGLYSINTPVISTQPQSQTIDAGAPVTFSIVAGGSPPFTYQWKFNGANIAGATNQSYTIASTTPGDAGPYKVVVSNSDGPTTSATASLTVVTTPAVVTQPVSQVAYVNTSVSFSATARGGLPLSYQWYLNGSPVAGANTSTLTLAGVQPANAGDYTLVVTNSYGNATSASAHLGVFSGAITNGLMTHLAFDNTYADSSGNGVNGAAVGAPTFEAGQIGQGVHIISNGDISTNDYVTLGTPGLVFGTNDFSFSFWAKILSQNDDKPFISNKDWGSGGNAGWVLATEGGGMKWNLKDDQSGRRDSATVAPQLKDGNWHNVVVIFIRSGLGSIYVDGQFVTAANMAPDPGKSIGSLDTALAVNLGQDGNGTYTDGGGAAAVNMVMDDLGVWNRALTPSEAASIYVQGQQAKDLTTASGAPVILPATIASQPVSETVSPGSDVTFTVTAGGTAPFNYQWWKDGAPISGQVASNLTLTAVQAGAAGDYAVVVSNSGGTNTSQTAKLVVFGGTVAQNLVAHLKFDGNYTDSSGRSNNAAAVGTPGFATGKIGQAMHFVTKADGSEFSYASLGYPTDLQFDTNDFSVAFWVDYSSAGDDPAFLGNKNWDSSSNTGWGLFHQDPTDYLRVSITGTPRGSGNRMNATLSGPTLKDGNWHHIAVSFWRNQNAYTYVDGSLVNVTALTITGSVDTVGQTWTRGTATGSMNVNIGQDGTGSYIDNSGGVTGGTANIDGLVDDVGFWTRVLTPQEIVAIVNAGGQGKDLSQAVVGTPSVQITSVSVSGGNITITVTGTSATSVLEFKPNLDTGTSWQNLGPISGSKTVPISGAQGYYRVTTP